MEIKFKETKIPNEYSTAMSNRHLLVGAPHVDKVTNVLFHGVSTCLSTMKNTSVGKALVFRALDGRFLAAGKVQYIANTDDPNNPAAGRWDYTWTTYEDDLDGYDTIDVANNALVTHFFKESAQDLYTMKFADDDTCITLMVSLVEFIIKWLKENAHEGETTTLVLNGAFKGVSAVEADGTVSIGIIPDGAMKVLIKDDASIQDV